MMIKSKTTCFHVFQVAVDSAVNLPWSNFTHAHMCLNPPAAFYLVLYSFLHSMGMLWFLQCCPHFAPIYKFTSVLSR